jgi:hypothetical protein
MNEAAALPSPTVVLSDRFQQYYGRLRLPPGRRPFHGSSPLIGPARSGGMRSPPGRGGPPQFPPSLSVRSTPSTPGSPSGLRSRLSTPSMAFALRDRARLSLPPTSRRAHQRRGRLRFMLRTARSLPPTGLLTLRFDAKRFHLTPAACYRASWQLPGPDFHRQATTSMQQLPQAIIRPPVASGHTPMFGVTATRA